MSGTSTRLRRALVGLVWLLAGCVVRAEHPDDAPVVAPTVGLPQLEAWAWLAPADDTAPDRWEPLDEAGVVALTQLINLLLRAAPDGALAPERRRQADALAAYVGVALREVTVAVEADGTPREIALWVVHELADDRRGRGTYLIRRGPSSSGPVEILLEAPHSRYDRKTGALALRLLIEVGVEAGVEAGGPRALFLNSAHRYRQRDGTRRRQLEPEGNPADAAHNPDHPLARVTAAALAERDLVVIQLHGFRPPAPTEGSPPEPSLIVSSGRRRPDRVSARTHAQLQRALPEQRCGHHGVDTVRLGALANVQGQAARLAGRCFVHVELDEPLRARLLEDAGLRRRFAAALFDGAREEARGGCP